MIANFFRSLEQHRVEYLLISGQATVLYGAATFSEDIDLWINPAAENNSRLIATLRECCARYYKLTPPLIQAHLARGHGFHFVLPSEAGPETFVDIMGQPPRVGPFTANSHTARLMQTDWGPIRTVGLKELVEIKKTQRIEDYPIIGNLVLAWFRDPVCSRNAEDFQWAMDHIFTVATLREFFEEQPEAVHHVAKPRTPALRTFAEEVVASREVPEEIEHAIAGAMQERMMLLQQRDRRYWREIIAELRQFRAQGVLMREGDPV
jgi:hypothetical protein